MSAVTTNHFATGCPVQSTRNPPAMPDQPQPATRRRSFDWRGWIKRGLGQLQPSRVAEIGWALRQTKGNFIWDAPRQVLSKGPRPSHSKVVSLCPAVLDHESRLIEIVCPIDARIRFRRDAQGHPALENVLGDASPIRSSHLSQMVKLVSEKEWRHPQRPIVQVITPYLFLADEPVWLTQLPPIHAYLPTPWPGLMISGRYPIDVWPRTLMWAFEWHDVGKDLSLKRGDPWFTVRFETFDPNRKARLVKAKLTAELDTYLQGMDGVSNYVRGTFSLFDVARKRRPKTLLSVE